MKPIGAKPSAAKNYVFSEDNEYLEETKAGGYSFILPEEVNNYVVSFTFSDTSLCKSEYCFNGPNVSIHDYQKILEFFQKLSRLYVDDALEKNHKQYNIKQITSVSQKRSPDYVNNVMRVLDMTKWDENDTPNIMQASLYNSKECVLEKAVGIRSKAPRIYFILGDYGCLSFILFDPYHSFFPTEDRG